jgi:SAM-dependent methyltransferase
VDLSERPNDRAPGAEAPRTHPWEIARARLVADLLGSAPLGRVVDVGAGDAFVARTLAREAGADIVAVDAAYSDADLVRYATAGVRTARAIPAGEFDTALLLDVLEHVADDAALLRDVVAHVAPRGRVLITVPAWPALFSAHDRMLAHHRRYRPRDVRTLARAAGLRVVRSGGAFFSLLPLRALGVARERALRTMLRIDVPADTPGDPQPHTQSSGQAAAPQSAAPQAAAPQAGGQAAAPQAAAPQASGQAAAPQACGGHGVGAWRGGAVVTRVVAGALGVDALWARALSRVHVEIPGLTYFALCEKREHA